MVLEPAALTCKINGFRLLFDPRLGRSFVADWEPTAKALLSRLHRELLERPNDTALAALVEDLLGYPDVPKGWQTPDLAAPSEPCLVIRLRKGDLSLAFLTTLTIFNAPQNVTLEELRLESWFPLDDETRRACEALAAPG
jgi:hypothetical protein